MNNILLHDWPPHGAVHDGNRDVQCMMKLQQKPSQRNVPSLSSAQVGYSQSASAVMLTVRMPAAPISSDLAYSTAAQSHHGRCANHHPCHGIAVHPALWSCHARANMLRTCLQHNHACSTMPAAQPCTTMQAPPNMPKVEYGGVIVQWLWSNHALGLPSTHPLAQYGSLQHTPLEMPWVSA